MQENVGRMDSWIRLGLGGGLAVAGIRALKGGLVMPAVLFTTSALLVKSAITRVCPVNGLLGIDTRKHDGRADSGPKQVPMDPGKRMSDVAGGTQGVPASPFGEMASKRSTAPAGAPNTPPMGSRRAPGDVPSVVTGDAKMKQSGAAPPSPH